MSQQVREGKGEGERNRNKKWELEKTKLGLVEGVDEVNFFKALLEHLGKKDEIQVKDYAGKSQIGTFLSLLVAAPLCPDLDALMLVRDTDDQPIKAVWNSVCDRLSNIGIRPPSKHGAFSEGKPRVAIFLMPDGASEGMLEDLCRRAVQQDPATPFVDAYFKGLAGRIEELEAAGEEGAAAPLRQEPNVRAKAWAHAFLASRSKPDRRVGEAAASGYWPFGAPAFAPLLDLLNSM